MMQDIFIIIYVKQFSVILNVSMKKLKTSKMLTKINKKIKAMLMSVMLTKTGKYSFGNLPNFCDNFVKTAQQK